MSTGWDKGGSDRLFCEEPPGGEDDIIPACFLGRAPWPAVAGTAPAISITTGDFSFEIWGRRKVGNSPGGDVNFLSGLASDDTGLAGWGCVLLWDDASDDVTASFADGSGGTATITAAPTRRGTWNHYAINADRDGNLQLFIDNISKGTSSIAALTASLANPEAHALIEDQALGIANYDVAFNDWASNIIFPVVVGPFAVHNRLLTQDEIQASVDSKYVQNISSVTQVLWDWTEINGETGWELDTAKMLTCFRMGLQMPAGMPLGAANTVTVRDKSGNGNDWTVPTLAAYTTTTATKMNAPFGADAVYR